VSTSSTTPLSRVAPQAWKTLTVHLGLDELIDHWTLLAGESDLRRQVRCAVRRDRAGGVLLWSGPHLIFHGLTAHPIRRSPSPMVPAPVLVILAVSQVYVRVKVVGPAGIETR
jgi:hypothetical protein